MLDLDRISASFGRRYIQDDGVLWMTHGSVLSTDWPEAAKAQVTRDYDRKRLSREDFLASLGLQVRLYELGLDAARFKRAFELLNKTNQFNTTGRRWAFDEIRAAVNAGARLIVFDVEDRFTSYGLVGVCILNGDVVEQFVMSCRVVGLDVEIAVMSVVLKTIGSNRIRALFAETSANLLCRDLWARCGFEREDGGWARSGPSLVGQPAHISLTDERPARLS